MSIFAYLENSIHIENTRLVQEQEVQKHVSLDQLDKVYKYINKSFNQIITN